MSNEELIDNLVAALRAVAFTANALREAIRAAETVIIQARHMGYNGGKKDGEPSLKPFVPTPGDMSIGNEDNKICDAMFESDGLGTSQPDHYIPASSLAISKWTSECPWRPIETAPKDGTLVLVYAPRPPEERWSPAVWDMPAIVTTCSWHRDAGWAVDDVREVTHWCPIPASPELGDTGCP